MSQYRMATARDLQPGEWVMDFPRDKQVALVILHPVVNMVSPNGGHLLANRWVNIIYTDDSQETLPAWSIVFVALPELKRPYLALSSWYMDPFLNDNSRFSEWLKEEGFLVDDEVDDEAKG